MHAPTYPMDMRTPRLHARKLMPMYTNTPPPTQTQPLLLQLIDTVISETDIKIKQDDFWK
jgi:hypothetical protein